MKKSVITEASDFRVAFSAATKCVQSTAWLVNETDRDTGKILIVTGESRSGLSVGNYFRLSKGGVGDNVYEISWCPTDVCPTCRWTDCGTVGGLVENGKRLLALGANVLPVMFERA